MRSPSHTQHRRLQQTIRRVCHAIARRAAIAADVDASKMDWSVQFSGNMKPVAQRTEMSLMPRPAWDQSEASDGDNEDEPAPTQPVQPRRILRAKSVLGRTGQHVPVNPSSSSILQSRPPTTRPTRIESRNNSGQNPLSASESSSNGSRLQTTAATSMRRTRSSNTTASRNLNIITENESRNKTRAVSHSRAARSGLSAESDNRRTGKVKGKATC